MDRKTALLNKVNAVHLNNDIAKHAKRKELAESLAAFNRCLVNKWENSHTYANMLNAYVRCGDIEGARRLFQSYKESRINIDVVSCTTLMKGYCALGDLDSALSIFADMLSTKPIVKPNIRTINTFLRGCVQVGDVNQGEQMLIRMQKDFKITPDISTWEYIVSLLCHGLKLDKALPIIGRIKYDTENYSGLAAMYVCVARAYALVDDIKNCRKAILKAYDALTADELSYEQPVIRKEDENSEGVPAKNVYKGAKVTCPEVDEHCKSTQSKEVVGGKRAWNTSDDINDTRSQSLTLYRAHRREELRFELTLIEHYLSTESTLVLLPSSSSSSSSSIPRRSQNLSSINPLPSLLFCHYPCNRLLTYLSRVLSFSSNCNNNNNNNNNSSNSNNNNNTDKKQNNQELIINLLKALKVGFGLDAMAALVNKSKINMSVVMKTAVTAVPKKKKSKVSSVNLNNENNKPISISNNKPISISNNLAPGDSNNNNNNSNNNNNNTSISNSTSNGIDALTGDTLLSYFKLLLEDHFDSDGYIDFESFSRQRNRDSSLHSDFALAAASTNSLNEGQVRSTSSTNVPVPITTDLLPQCNFDNTLYSNNNKDRHHPSPAIVAVVDIDGKKEVSTKVKVEICSGAGEWAVEQALHDPSSLWVTMELRHDRLYQILTRAFLRKAENVVFIGGDARSIMRHRINDSSVSEIFVNHPEPPQQTGKAQAAESQASHLLDSVFFQDICRVLTPGGILTIVTDNIWYGRLLLRQLKTMDDNDSLPWCSIEPTTRNTASSSGEEEVERWNVKEQMGRWTLYEGHPGRRGGHIVVASSYFDRLWKRGALVERYFLSLQKNEINSKKSKKRKSRT